MNNHDSENILANFSNSQHTEIINQIISYGIIAVAVLLVYFGIRYLTNKNQPIQNVNLQDEILKLYKEIIYFEKINSSGYDRLDYETESYFVVCQKFNEEFVNFQIVYNKGDGTISYGKPRNSYCLNCSTIHEDIFEYCPDCGNSFVDKIN